MEARNLFEEIGCTDSRLEILDWYHLRENLYKVGGSLKRLKQAETNLWHGQVDEAICEAQRSTERSRRSQRFAIALFSHCRRKQADNFCAYLTKHRHRLINYQYFQEQLLSSIGSGAVESAVKLS
jgi:hypothetical protein